MAGAPSRGVWKQLDGLFRFGASGQLGDAELLGRFVAGRRDEDGRGRVRGAGGAAWADGPGRLPPRAGRPACGRGRVPGDVPGPGARPARSHTASNWPTGCTASPAARRSTPGRGPTAAGRGSGRRSRRRARQPGRTMGRSAASCARSSTRSSPGCRPRIAARWSSASSTACRARWPRDSSASPRARSPAGSPGPRTSCAIA